MGVPSAGLLQAAGWSLLTLAGFAASLSLIEAGGSVGYQHYLPLAELSSRPVGVAVLLLQFGAILVGGRRALLPMLAGLRSWLPGWRIPALAVLVFFSGAVLNRDLTRYGLELVTSSVCQVLSLATTALAVRALPHQSLEWLRIRFNGLLGTDDGHGRLGNRLPVSVVVLALLVILVCACLSLAVYGGHPHIADEVAYLFQAKTFATGRITLPNPEVPAAFELFLIESGAHGWFSPMPPGFAAALTPGVWLGVPWLVNPVLTGINVVLTSLVLQSLYGARVSRLATLLFAVSPWNLFLGMSFMPHAFTLCCALAATLGVIVSRRTGLQRWAWLAGLALGMVANIRQLDAIVMAAALGLWAIGVGGHRLRWPSVVGLIVGSMITAAPQLAFNQFFTGKIGTFPIMSYFDRVFGVGSNAYGFGANRGMGWALDPNPGHGPVDGVINAALNVAATQVELLGWSVGSLLLVYAFILRARLQQADRLMLGMIGIVALGYFFNWFAGGPDFGARYWYLMSVPLLALTARSVLSFAETDFAAVPHAQRRGGFETRLLSGIVVWVAGALLLFIPWRSFDKYWHYRGVRGDVAALASRGRFAQGLVLVAGREFPDYASAAMYNSLDFTSSAPIYAHRRSAASDSAIVLAYPDRVVWLLDGPSVSGSEFIVRAGPLSTAEALQRVAVPAAVP